MPRAITRLGWFLQTPAGLAAMFIVALALRIAIAPHFGFYGDLNLFRRWTLEMRQVGMHEFYKVDPSVDYPPGYLYFLWAVGKLSKFPSFLLLKLPSILGDLVLAWIVGLLAARLARKELVERTPVRAWAIAGVLFNPAVFGLSAGWGQVDVIPVCFMMGSFLLLFTRVQTFRREIIAAVLFGIAFSIKPQTCLAFPVIAYALYLRYFHDRAKSEIASGVLKTVALGGASIAGWVLLGLPFAKGPVEQLHLYQRASSLYPVTSANAFNFWGIFGFWLPDSVVKAGGETVVNVTGFPIVRILGIPAARFGLILFIAAAAYVVWRVHRAVKKGLNPSAVLFVGSALLALLGYTFLTRMHERYMFLGLMCLAPLVFSVPFRIAYASLSPLFLLALWYPYAEFNTQWHARSLAYQPWFNWIDGGFVENTWQKKMWSAVVTLIVVRVALGCWRWLEKFSTKDGSPEHDSSGSVVKPRRTLLKFGRFENEILDAEATGSLARWGSLSIVALAVVFGLVILRNEIIYAENLNDSALHLLLVRWAGGQLHEGRIPFDGWFPYLSLGSSFFHHYQSLPHTLTAAFANLAHVRTETMYVWLLYLLLALWPVSVYFGARLLDWNRWTAAAAAAISPLITSVPGYGFEHRSYVWQGYGVYSQEWGMLLLPIAWGFTWRAVSRGKNYAAAASALALTIACHFITAYLALLTVGVWVIVIGRSTFVRRLSRAAITTGASLLIAAWVLVPLLTDMKYSAQSAYYKGTIFNDSYGAAQVMKWLFTGQLFDAQRLPVVTVFCGIGILRCIVRFRRDPRAQAILGAFLLSLLLFFGRRTFGSLLNVLPGMKDIQIHRFVMGVDLAAMILAGFGLSWLLRRVHVYLSRTRVAATGATIITAIAGAIVLFPAYRNLTQYSAAGRSLQATQLDADAHDGRDIDKLIQVVQSRHDARVYSGLRGNWGKEYRVGWVPVHAWLANREVDAIGFTFRTVTSLSTDIEVAFDETNPAQYEMLNVRYLILPVDRAPAVPATLIMQSGRHRLYEVKTSGYFQAVDRSASVSADRTNIEPATADFRKSRLALQNIYPGVAFSGAAAPPPTFSGPAPPGGIPGTVLAQNNTLKDGMFDAAVDMKRPAAVLLKATYDPRWTATVDGKNAKPVMMAPSLVGVDVPAGLHSVSFKYKPYAAYPLLILIGGLTLAALIVVPRRMTGRSTGGTT